MTSRRKHHGWVRWLGLAVVPLVIVSSFLGVLVGITGLCIGLDDMAGLGHPDHVVTLCLFFCGAVVPTVILLASFWLVLGTLVGRRISVPLPLMASFFRPPRPLPA